MAVVEDLYVHPAYRGRGIATQLFRRVLKVRYKTENTKNRLASRFSCCGGPPFLASPFSGFASPQNHQHQGRETAG